MTKRSSTSAKVNSPRMSVGWRVGTAAGGPKLQVSLLELHDPDTGLLDSERIAQYLRIPLRQLAGALGRNYSTVHKTPSAPSLQVPLRSIKKSLEILEQVLGSRSAALAWLNSPHPELDRRTPLEVLLEGGAPVIESMLEGALEGIPS